MKKKANVVNVILYIILAVVFCVFIYFQYEIATTGVGNRVSVEQTKKLKALTDEITIDCKTDGEKVEAIRNWIINNIEYRDGSIISMLQWSNIDKIIKTKKGICIDYAALFAAMCRYQNIPCYVVCGVARGKNQQGKHAWNRVYVNGVWYEVDTTHDATHKDEPNKMFGFVKRDYLKNGLEKQDPDYKIKLVY